MTAPVVVVEAPPAWVAADVARPAIATSTGASWSSWAAMRSPADDAAIVTACVEAPVPGWVEDMRPAFVARTVALAGATAERIASVPTEVTDAGDHLALRPVGRAEPVLGGARTFLGFDRESAFTCFAVCAARSPEPANATAAACNEVVVRARLDGGTLPPRPGVALRAVTWAVHNPRPTSLAFGAATVLVGALAVATRRKPRARS